MNKNKFYNLADEFLIKIFRDLDKSKIKLEPYWTIDHLCYRTESIESYENLKSFFLNLGQLLIVSDVNGRSISTFKLFEPVTFQNYSIPLVELPAPKKGKTVKEGFEHIEIVINESFEEIMSLYPQLNFDTSGFSKHINKELEVILGERNIKFHHQSLEEIIKQELTSSVLQRQ